MRAASGVMPSVGGPVDETAAGEGGGVAGVGGNAEPPPSAIKPRARRPATSPKRAAARKRSAKSNGGGAPVDHYDDLEAGEIVSLLDSLEDGALAALLEYEQSNLARPRVTSAIEGTRARREASRQS
jgi:hypothetical protein